MDASSRTPALAALVAVLAWGAPAQAQDKPAAADKEAFVYEERSTVETIPFRSLAEDSLASTVIEGGLEAPAAGVPVRSARSSAEQSNEDFYLDPLALQPRDSRTDLGRSEVPVEIRFSNPKVVPGQSWSNNYIIRPPENRNYDALNTNMSGR